MHSSSFRPLHAQTGSIHPASPHRKLTLKLRARGMRLSPTPSEQVLWQHLRGRKLGVQFRRQVVIGQRFIVDFCASSIRLVLEVDGGYHQEAQRADARRDAWLARRGYTILRLTDETVMANPQLAVELVSRALRALGGVMG